MKRNLFITALAGALFFACSPEEAEKIQSTDENTVDTSDDISYSITLPDNPCDLISPEMVATHFDVSVDSLEKDEYNREGVSWTEHCTYKWKKDNFEEINKANQEKLLASMKNPSVKNAMKVGKSIEQPHKSVGITNLKAFESVEEAQKYFENSHKKPTQKDMEKLNEQIDKTGDEKGLSDDQKEKGKTISGGIAESLSFISVDGIGDMASWDELGSQLDVLVGTTQFGVKVHTGEGLEHDIEKAKALAAAILSNF